MSVAVGNGTEATLAKGPEVDLELELCAVNEDIIKLVIEEDNLRELKNEVAKEYRTKIADTRQARREKEKRRLEIQQAQTEVLTDVILESVPKAN